MPESGFKQLFHRVVQLLDKNRLPYLVIGGLASGVLGEPRLTHDVDVIVKLDTGKMDGLLEEARKQGFTFSQDQVHQDIRERGTFRLGYQDSWADFIITSTTLEESALTRAHRVKLLDTEANFPSAEDFILFKLIPGRPKDLLDVESVILRQGERLDRGYLQHWAQQISDEMEDLRLFNTLQRMLNP